MKPKDNETLTRFLPILLPFVTLSLAGHTASRSVKIEAATRERVVDEAVAKLNEAARSGNRTSGKRFQLGYGGLRSVRGSARAATGKRKGHCSRSSIMWSGRRPRTFRL